MEQSASDSTMSAEIHPSTSVEDNTISNSSELCKLLNRLDNAVQQGNLDDIEEIIKNIQKYSLSDENAIVKLYCTNKNCITQYDLIVTACKLGNPTNFDVLQYILQQTNVLHYLKNPGVTVNEEDNQRTMTFRLAICSGDSRLAEMLYDFWSTKIHWTLDNKDNNVSEVINRVKVSLERARDDCAQYLETKQQILVDIQCLCVYSSFQNELYNELDQLKRQIDCNGNKENAIRDVMIIIHKVYKKYGCIEQVRLKKVRPEDEAEVVNFFSDKSTFYFQALSSIMYEMYFQKLDFNVSMLILDNWTFLKELIVPSDERAHNLSNELECTIYYFIGRIKDNWRLYLPSGRTTIARNTLGVSHSSNQYIFVSFEYDLWKIRHGLLLYLERQKFEKCLLHFTSSLEDRPENMLSHDACLSNMRDDYALQKILFVINVAIDNLDEFDENKMLIIDAASVTAGEMLKNTSKTSQISAQTQALVQAEFSTNTVKILNRLRDEIFHVACYKYPTENATSNENNKYESIRKDFIDFREGIENVQRICKPFLDMSLIEKGLHVLEERIRDYPFDARSDYIDQIVSLDDYNYSEIYRHHIKKRIEQKYWNETGLSEILLREILWVTVIKKKLGIDKRKEKHNISKVIITSKYFTAMNNSLKNIKINYEKWNNMIPNLQKYCKNNISNDLDMEQVNRIKQILSHKLNKGVDADNIKALIKDLTSIKDFSGEWQIIKTLLAYWTTEVSEFKDYKYLFVKDSKIDKTAIDNILLLMEKVTNASEFKPTVHAYTLQNNILPGITELGHSTIEKGTKRKAKKNPIKTDNDDKTKQNLIESCFKRISQLNDQLQYNTDILVMKYKHDQTFRIVVNILLLHIYNILKKIIDSDPDDVSTRQIKEIYHELSKKSTKLLAGINVRHLLAHSNPLLEIIGSILDDRDLPTEIILKAIEICIDNGLKKALQQLINL